MQLLSRSEGRLQVLAARYAKVHDVEPTLLRPYWMRAPTGEWAYSLNKRARTEDAWRAVLADGVEHFGDVYEDAHGSSVYGARAAMVYGAYV